MALPAMESMHNAGVLCAVATADKDPEVQTMFRAKAAEYGVPFKKITYKNYEEQLQDWLVIAAAQCVFVMTFPWRISAAVLAVPSLGFYNFHYGLLPQMRGADPIFESIRQGLPHTGVTVHVMDETFDTGPIALQEQIPLVPEYTYGMVSSQVAFAGAKLCSQMVLFLRNGNVPKTTPQDETLAKYWPRIVEADLQIRWADMDSKKITALVRSCNPIARGIPATINNWKIGVCDVSDVNLQGDASAIAPGTIIAIDPQNGLIVYCSDGKGLKFDVIYTAEGYFPGYKLAFFGIAQGMVFGN